MANAELASRPVGAVESESGHNPPVIRLVAGRSGSGKSMVPVFFFILMGALLLTPWLSSQGIHLPTCPVKRGLGVPCLSCGVTRCLLAMSQGDLSTAAGWNPLFFLACLLVSGGFGLWLSDRLMDGNRWGRLVAAVAGRGWLMATLLVVALVGNWIYLLHRLPH